LFPAPIKIIPETKITLHVHHYPWPSSFCGEGISITGAARGIGYAIARQLAKLGANLALADISEAELKPATETLEHDFPKISITCTVVDVSGYAVDSWIIDTLVAFGELDGCVNNAGILGKWY
jgi:NAD(P)-dependent dehydrogenase (short-subunit alcohol dehydrogenase family)